ncbi:MAG: PIN domain-containing protein [Moraxellaceae bacterium]|nr:PIN domain-containing protein [Moraxellaceae bacterium]
MATKISLDRAVVSHKQSYFIDTNVWFWFAGGGVDGQSGRSYQIHSYPAFIGRILDAGAPIYHSSLTLVELAHVIERKEYERQFPAKEIGIKEFRKDDRTRKLILGTVKAAWASICQVSRCLDEQLGDAFSADVLALLEEAELDSYDAVYCALMSKHGILNIVTDDADLMNVSGITLLTANRKVLAA